MLIVEGQLASQLLQSQICFCHNMTSCCSQVPSTSVPHLPPVLSPRCGGGMYWPGAACVCQPGVVHRSISAVRGQFSEVARPVAQHKACSAGICVCVHFGSVSRVCVWCCRVLPRQRSKVCSTFRLWLLSLGSWPEFSIVSQPV